MTDRPSIRDVARAAGVSVATASRVMSGSTYPVAEATRARVQEAAAVLRFVPNALARSLSRARSDTLGVVVPSIVNPYYAAMVEAIDLGAREAGLTMLLALTQGDEGRREAVITDLLARRVDGLIIGAGFDDHHPGRPASECPVPTVLIGEQPNGGFPILRTDNLRAGRLAAEHLWSLGHRDFTYLTGLESWHDFHDRGQGMAAWLKEAGGTPPRIIQGLLDEDMVYKRLSRGDIGSTALVAATDRHALAALAALADLGRRVPDEVSVVGFDDYLTSGLLRPALTTVRIPAAEMGRRAVQMLRDGLEGRELPAQTWFPAELVLRSSTAPVRQFEPDIDGLRT